MAGNFRQACRLQMRPPLDVREIRDSQTALPGKPAPP